MNIFPIRFSVGCLELQALVTESDQKQRFKVEMVTGEPDPIILRKAPEGDWIIEQSGGRTLSAETYSTIQKEIEAKLATI